MKVRIGFVSNSSSASFILKWRPSKWTNALDTIAKNLQFLFSFGGDVKSDKEEALKEWGQYWEIAAYKNQYDENDIAYVRGDPQERFYYNGVADIVKYVMCHTKKIDNYFETAEHIIMYNEITDYSIEAKELLFALVINGYEIISAEINEDQ